MHIQKFPPQPQARKSPERPPQDDDWGQALKVIGQSSLQGAVEGMGWSYLAHVADSFGPQAGAITRLGMFGLGAAVGVKQYGPLLSSKLDGTLGPLAAGVYGGGRVAMMAGLSPAPDLSSAMVGGLLNGGFLGIIEAPLKAQGLPPE